MKIEQKTPTIQASTVYESLASLQRSDEGWNFQPVIDQLLPWADRFDLEFKLALPAVAIAIDRTRVRHCLGHYRPGHNGFGLRCEIVISDSHVQHSLQENAWWQVLGTLLHELLHCWQEFHGTAGCRNYHNRQLRQKAAELGLIIDERGVTEYDPGSPFFEMLARYGVAVPNLPTPSLYKPRKTQEKLRLWTCGCTKVRIGRSHFQALCLDCHNRFELVK